MTHRQRIKPELRNGIFDRTRGKCHICHRRLAFKNYGVFGARGAWHVEHSIALANGGTNHGNNLFAACIPCNIEKCTWTSRTARAWNGQHRAPLSVEKHEAAKTGNSVAGAAFSAGVGAILGGPPGAFIGGILGLAFGYEANPDD